MKFTTKITRIAATVAATALVLTGAVATGTAAVAAEGDLSGVAPIEQRNAQTVTADGLPTVQLDSGIVWTQVMNGNVVYAGGSFSQTRPANAAPGTNLTPRSNLLAYDVTTGNLLPFAPQINGTVKSLALSPDGRTLYVGGSFSKVGDVTRFNVAAFDTVTGQLSNTFKPAIGGSYVNAIVATDTVVYFGGLIGAAGGISRQNLAAANASNGQVLGWAPTTDLQVDSMVMAPGGGKLIIAGRFARVNGVTQRGLGALDLTNGSLLPWSVTNTVKNGRNDGSGNSGKAGIWAVTADDHNVYGTGWVFADVATGNLEGLFAAEGQSGDIVWIADCHGDHYGVFSDGTNVYSTGHEHECTTAGGLPQGNGTMRNATVYTAERKGTLTRSPYVNSIYADWSGYPAPAAVNWFPDWLGGTASGMGQAGWTITGNDDYVVFGGEFIGLNNQRQQGLVRFARNPQGGAKQGPRLSGSDWTPTAKSVLPGTVAVRIGSNWDRDDRDLTYELWEQGASAPSDSKVGKSTFWNLPTVSLTASGLQAGSSHTYRVVVKDGDGNSATSSWVTATVTNTAPSAYASQVLNDDPSIYWRFGGDSLASDWAGSYEARIGSGVTAMTDSPISGETGSARFNGTTNGSAGTSTTISATPAYSVELWFKSTSGSGGKLIGYGDARTGNSSSYDRHVYLTNSGQIIYGNYPGGVQTVSTPGGRSYADGSWHHVVATQGSGGMALYVDGQLAASNPSVTTAQGYTGYWRVGGDNLNGWPSQPSSSYFTGQIDEVAVYGAALNAQQVAQHYAIGTGAEAPTPSFTVAGEDLTRTFDGSASSADSGHSITGYEWDFGDSTPKESTAIVSHTYSSAGTYTVTLRVTDDRGLTATKTASVTVTAPHEAPTAVIGSEADGLTVSFSSAGSTAAEGSEVTAYAWDFGDGETSTEANPTHSYDGAGTYTVALVVTDDSGADSAPATTEVEVEHADPIAAFDISVSGPTVHVDADESAASDGASLTYAWNWGDNSTVGSGEATTHTYEEAGTYTVTLTVTDSLGSSASVSHDVEVFAEVFLVRDTFERSSSSGWAAADIGGTWSGTTSFSVSDGVGKISLNKSQTRRTTLEGATASEFDMSSVFSVDRVADGGGIHFNLAGHRNENGEYRAKLRITAAGAVIVNLASVVGTAETLIAAKTLSGFTYTAGERLNVRFTAAQPTASRTDLKIKVWPVGSTEPDEWTATATSTEAALQGAGEFGVGAYGTGTITNGPVTISVDDVIVRGAGEEAAHIAPVAQIGSTRDGLVVSFDGSGSTTSDGATLAGYAWDFGDGHTSTEAMPTHAYDEAGTYEVSLTVTDSLGASSAVATASVTVAHADPIARFSESRSELSVEVDGSASTASDGATLSYSWSWGDDSDHSTGETASHTYAAAGEYEVTLTVTDSLGASATTSKIIQVSAESFVARDDFQRTVGSGWGTAVTGGDWSATAGLSVADGAGLLTVGRSQTRRGVLAGVSAENVDARLTFSTDKVADGGGLHFNYAVRRSLTDEYRAKLRISAAGVVAVGIAKIVDGTETLIANRNLSGYTHTADAKLQVRFQAVTEGASTTLRVKVWADGTEEPSSWWATASDATSSLQGPGEIAVSSYVAGTATNGPVVVAIHDLSVQ
ncbi:PKD domain-containing protein [Microbacterium sp. MC2]